MADEIATLISSAGLTNETFLVLCVIAVIVIGAIVVIITSRPILIFIHILLLVQAYVQEKEDYLMKNNYLKLLKQTMFTNLKIILKVFLIMLTY